MRLPGECVRISWSGLVSEVWHLCRAGKKRLPESQRNGVRHSDAASVSALQSKKSARFFGGFVAAK
jgi:hypothetical protein